MIDIRSLDGPGEFGGCSAPCPAISSEIHQLSESLGKAIDAKDHFTSRHSEQVATLAHTLALGMGLSANQADHIHIAGHLHDIGKIGVPGRILHQTGKLAREDWQAIKRHPRMGADIIAPVRFLSRNGIVDMVWAHHESFDGAGYPRGLSGADIPLGARIIAVADSMSAMLQDRPYRRRMSFEHAVEDIARLSGTRYDPRVVEILLRDSSCIFKIMQCLEMEDENHTAPAVAAGGISTG